jgi:hypothetical protein
MEVIHLGPLFGWDEVRLELGITSHQAAAERAWY